MQTVPICSVTEESLRKKRRLDFLKFPSEWKKEKNKIMSNCDEEYCFTRGPVAPLCSAVTWTNFCTFIVTADKNDSYSNIFKSQAFQKMRTALAKQSISRQMQWNVLKELLFSPLILIDKDLTIKTAV